MIPAARPPLTVRPNEAIANETTVTVAKYIAVANPAFVRNSHANSLRKTTPIALNLKPPNEGGA